MLRTGIFFLLLFLLLWAPWMDSEGSVGITERVFDAFGPVASSCFDVEGNLLHDGVEVSWYPLGRIVHTCSGDYIVWIWGAIKEQGGVYKRADEIQAVQTKALSCEEVLARQDKRVSTTTNGVVAVYEGPYATELDFSIFKDADKYKGIIREALKRGPSFAGKFSIAEWGCGSNCQQHAVIDVETGKVVAYGPQTEYGIEYSLDSTLLITNPARNLPKLPESVYEIESVALSIARLPREYYRLTTDVLSGTQYLVRECIESAAMGYIEVEDNRLGVTNNEG